MANTCAYRAGATDEAVEALYKTLQATGTLLFTRNWEDLTDEQKRPWIEAWHGGHKAYRDYIKAENRQLGTDQ